MSFSWENTLLALESQGEKRVSLPYIVIALSLAQGGQLRFLKSKVNATADLVSSPQYAGLNEFDLFFLCVCLRVSVNVCVSVYTEGCGKVGNRGNQWGLLPGVFLELQEPSLQKPLEEQPPGMSPKQQSGCMILPFPINTRLGLHITGAGLSSPGPAEGEKGGGESKAVARRA